MAHGLIIALYVNLMNVSCKFEREDNFYLILHIIYIIYINRSGWIPYRYPQKQKEIYVVKFFVPMDLITG